MVSKNEKERYVLKKALSILLATLIFFSTPLMIFAETEIADSEKQAILSALYESDISTVRSAIEAEIISCEELTEYYLERIEKYNKDYNCFITLCDDSLEVARERDIQLSRGENTGLLFGIPIVIKDNMNLSGYYTTNGHYKANSPIATENAKVVDYLLEQGAIIIGKTNMSTDAQDARTSYSEVIGETKNAYNTWLSAGGSSGGSAVAVSQNFAIAGLGTDTNSSLRIPAILNGCVSLRPTLNLIPFDGCTHLSSARDVIGPITRTVYDQAIMLDILTSGEFSYTENLNNNAFEGKRIGILSELTYPISTSIVKEQDSEKRSSLIKFFSLSERVEKNIDKEISSAFQSATDEIKSLGAEVVTVSFPELFDLLYPTFINSDRAYKNNLYEKFKQFMVDNNLDAVIYPTYLSAPLKTGMDDNGKYWNVWQNQVFINNCKGISPSTGMPEIAIPIGYHSTGAGIGMEIIADKNCEQLLLDMAYTYTEKYNHREPSNGAPDIYADKNQGNLQTFIDKYTVSVDAEIDGETTQPITNVETAKSAPIVVIAVIIIMVLILVAILVVLIIKKS